LKSIHVSGPKALQQHLIAARLVAGLTQRGFAEKLGKHQSYVSKVESGVRRLDVIEFIGWMQALELDPTCLISELVSELGAGPRRARRRLSKPV
jgi:transcriptional regulator with XRE-family HTH domain